MTKFMKFEIIAYYFLKVLCYACAGFAVFCLIGFIRSLFLDITASQYILNSIYLACFAFLPCIFYGLMEVIEEDFDSRARRMRIHRRYQAAHIYEH